MLLREAVSRAVLRERFVHARITDDLDGGFGIQMFAHLAKNQAMLRTLFDAVPDIVTLTRFSDGKLFEVNEEFLKRTGLGREAALATSTVQLGAWARALQSAAQP